MSGWDFKKGKLVYITTVDKVGRVYIPKVIRDIIKAKTFLVRTTDDCKILLTPLSEKTEDVTYVDEAGKVYLPKSVRNSKTFVLEIIEDGILLDPIKLD